MLRTLLDAVITLLAAFLTILLMGRVVDNHGPGKILALLPALLVAAYVFRTLRKSAKNNPQQHPPS